jgi:hypothetical protein
MARGPGIAALVVSVLAGHADAQPSATPPTQPPPTQQPLPPQPQPPPREQPQHVICFFGRPHECASVFLLELGARGNSDLSVTTGDIGLVIHDGLNAYGGTIGLVGITDASAETSVLYAARYRRYLGTWGIAGDVSVGYADGPALEVSIGWGDVIAVTAGINGYERDDGGHNLIGTAGFRIGAVAIGTLLYATAVVATGSR